MPDAHPPSAAAPLADLFAGLNVPHLHEYFGLWSILEEPFRAAVDRISGLDLRAHVVVQGAAPQPAASTAARSYALTEQGVAIVALSGPMMKHVSSLSGGSSTVLARRQVRAAVADPDVKAVLLVIDSPGGTVAGTFDLADDVAAAAQKKPLVAYIEDLGASAAYAVASQASRIAANRGALVGSIGTYAVIDDYSGRAGQLGIKVHVVRAGEFKGAGVAGTEVTERQLAEWQRIVDQSNAHFLAAVSAGRRLPAARVAELADGRVHLAADAVSLGLIDAVESLDQTLAALAGSLSRSPSQRTKTMSETAVTPAAAGAKPAETLFTELKVGGVQPTTIQDLRICCPGADEKFLVGQLDRRATIDQAQSAWMEEQNRRLAAAEKQLAEARTQAEAAAKKPGVEALGNGTASSAQTGGDPIAEFNAAVAGHRAAGKTQAQAVRAAVVEDPDRHEAFLAACAAARGKTQ